MSDKNKNVESNQKESLKEIKSLLLVSAGATCSLAGFSPKETQAIQ